MNIEIERNTEQNRWWVRMDDWRVSFNTAVEAEQFVERLNARLNAPIHGTCSRTGRPAQV